MNGFRDVSHSNSFSCNSSAHASSVMAPAKQKHGRPDDEGAERGWGEGGGGGRCGEVW